MQRFARAALALALAITCGSVAVAAPQPVANAPSKPGVQAVERMLEQGFRIGRNQMQSAERQYKLARQQFPDDPRLDYAYGLVLLRQMQYDAAAEHFASASREADPPSWPAARALIWTKVLLNDSQTALTLATELAARVQASDPAAHAEDRLHTAHWIGELLEAVRLLSDVAALEDWFPDLKEAIESAFDKELRDAYLEGRTALTERRTELDLAIDQTRSDTTQSQQKRQQEQQKQIELQIKELERNQSDLGKSAEQWKEWLRDHEKSVDRALAVLEQEYKLLQTRSESLSASQFLLEQEISLMRSNNNQVRGQQRVNWDREIQFREAEKFAYYTENVRVLNQADAVARQATQLIQKRQAAAQRFQAATGQLARNDQKLNRWTERLNADRKKLEIPPDGKSSRLAALERRASSLRSYLDLDLNAERERALKAFE